MCIISAHDASDMSASTQASHTFVVAPMIPEKTQCSRKFHVAKQKCRTVIGLVMETSIINMFRRSYGTNSRLHDATDVCEPVYSFRSFTQNIIINLL